MQICPECGRELARKATLMKHIEKQHAVRDEPSPAVSYDFSWYTYLSSAAITAPCDAWMLGNSNFISAT